MPVPDPTSAEALHRYAVGNTLLAQVLYLAKYIERMGTGTRDMIRRCRDARLPEPEFAVTDGFIIRIRRRAAPQVTPSVDPQVNQLNPRHLEQLAAALGIPAPQVTTQVAKLLLAADTAQSREELQQHVGLAGRKHFRESLLNPLIGAGWLALTIPDVPQSRLQKYLVTAKGREWLADLEAQQKRAQPET